MADYSNRGGDDNIYGGGSWGGGGMFAMVILLVVVFWVLFRNDGRRDIDGFGHGFGNGCGVCVQPTFKDESNFEEERNINSKLCKVDEDIWKTACKTQEVEHCEAEKTRALIEANYIQDLRDKLAHQEMKNQTLKSEMFTTKQIGLVNNKIEKVDEMIERLMCELPKRPPVFAECVTPNTHDIDCRREFFPRRGRCDEECFC